MESACDRDRDRVLAGLVEDRPDRMPVAVDLEQDLGVDVLEEEPRGCLGVQLDGPVGEGRGEPFGGPGMVVSVPSTL